MYHTWASVITKHAAEFTACNCNLAHEFLCLSELLYRSNMDLFAFLAVIWRHLQYLNLHSQSSSAANL